MGTRAAEARENSRGFDELKAWPQEALDYLHEEFKRRRIGAGQSYKDVLADLETRWGLHWNDSSLSRYYKKWRSPAFPIEQADAEARELMAAFKATPTAELEEHLRQLIAARALLSGRDLDLANPVQVVKLSHASKKLRMAEDKLQLDQERQRNADEKLALDKARLELEREKRLAIDKPALYLEAFRLFVETVQGDPEAAAVLNRNFDRFMVKIKAAA